MSKNQVRIDILNRADSLASNDYETAADCCSLEMEDQVENSGTKIGKNSNDLVLQDQSIIESIEKGDSENNPTDTADGRLQRKRAHACGEINQNWAEHKNVAEGLMDIALLSANANQLRFLITYNNQASTYYISLGLVALSLILQVAVGIALIFKRRMKRTRIKRTRTRINEFLIGGVFMVTVVNVLLAAFTTTDGSST